MNYSVVARDIISCVGGKENMKSAQHCATRLRLVLKDKNIVDEKGLEEIDAVKGTFYTNGQYQIILGSGVVNLVCEEVIKQANLNSENKNSKEDEEVKQEGNLLTNGQYQIILGSGVVNLVCEEVIKQANLNSENKNSKEDEEVKQEGNLLQRAVKGLSDIFVPIIPAIVAGGLMMGLYNVLTAAFFAGGKSIIDLYPQFAGIASMINLFSNAAFTFLPVLLGFSASKKFGGNPYLGAAMGMIMVHPELLNAYAVGTATEIPYWDIFGLGFSASKKFGGNPYLGAAMGMIMVHPELLNAYAVGTATEIPYWDIFGLHIAMAGYQGTVLPVLAVAWIMSTIEKRLHKITVGTATEIPYWDIFGLHIAMAGYQGTVLPVLAVAWIMSTIEKRLHKITPSWLDNLTTPLLTTLITGFVTLDIREQFFQF